MDGKEPMLDGSYLRNCLIRPRDDNTGHLFEFDADWEKAIVRLDGYAIVPREEYEQLRAKCIA